METLKYSFYLLECSGKEFPSLAWEFDNNLMFLFTWSIFLNYFLKRRRISFVVLCPGLLQDFFYLRVFLVCGTSGIPLIKKSISCQGVDITKMNVFFTNVFWDNYGLHTSLQEDVKMSDLLLFLKCFSES